MRSSRRKSAAHFHHFRNSPSAWWKVQIAPFVVAFATLGTFSACGSNDDTPFSPIACTGACACSASTCTCTKGGTCTLGGTSQGKAPDAGDDGGAIVAGAPPSDVSYHCDSKNNCDLTCGTGCTNTCDGQSVCAGSCGSNCTSKCGGTSDCTLSTGTNSTVTCDGGSKCNVVLDPGSTLSCQGNSTCTIQCPKGGCTADCTGSTGCTVDCGAGAPCHVQCNGKDVAECAPLAHCDGACQGATNAP